MAANLANDEAIASLLQVIESFNSVVVLVKYVIFSNCFRSERGASNESGIFDQLDWIETHNAKLQKVKEKNKKNLSQTIYFSIFQFYILTLILLIKSPGLVGGASRSGFLHLNHHHPPSSIHSSQQPSQQRSPQHDVI